MRPFEEKVNAFCMKESANRKIQRQEDGKEDEASHHSSCRSFGLIESSSLPSFQSVRWFASVCLSHFWLSLTVRLSVWSATKEMGGESFL